MVRIKSMAHAGGTFEVKLAPQKPDNKKKRKART